MAVGMLLPVLMLLGTLGSSQAPDSAGVIPPQVRPVADWLTAVKDGNEERLKAVFSERLRQQFDHEGWNRIIRTYQEVFRKEFGDYRTEDFSFEFKGDDNRGTVSVAYKGRTVPALQVVKENNGWRIDER